MCRQTKTGKTKSDAVAVDKLPANGKLFIDGKDRPLNIADHDAAQSAIEIGLSAVVATNLNGEQTTIPRERVQSLVQVSDRAPVSVDMGVFNGREINITGLAQYNQRPDVVANGERFEAPMVVTHDTCVVVEVGDLVSAAVLVYDLATNAIVFQNPASHERAIRRYVRAVMLLAEAETLENTEGEGASPQPEQTPRVIPEPRDADEVGNDSLPE